jgi:hypothetical protein
MLWRKIEKQIPILIKPYKDRKTELSVEAKHSCVYCCIHESYFGGIRNYHVEHYRPKSKFAALQDDYSNLFYSCAICNVFKGNDWIDPPVNPNAYSTPFYPDPSLIDYGQLLRVDAVSKRVVSEYITGRYLIERLFLNRPQLVIARRAHLIRKELAIRSRELSQLVTELGGTIEGNMTVRVVNILTETIEILEKMNTSIPYTSIETKRS